MSAEAFDPRRYAGQLTARPGVYRMIDAEGEVLYVGKAKNLRKRVSSYFLRASGNPRIESMLDQVADIEVTVTHTEDEALLLESTLIKKIRPRYNVYLRDDKSYPYLRITGDHSFPRVTFHRGSRKVSGRLFGPFPSGSAVRQTMTTIHKLFRLRNCDDTYFANRSRPCLQYQIKRCSAPCVGYIDEASYARDVADATDLLEGRNERLVSRLIKQMETASSRLEFEQAAATREKIAAVRRLQEQSHVVGGKGDFDIIVCASGGGIACAVVVSVRGGMHLGHQSFYPSLPDGTEPAELTEAFIGQYYLERKPPPEILVGVEPGDREWLEQSLSERAGRRVSVRYRLRGRRARLRDNASATLEQALESRLATRAGVRDRLLALQEALALAAPPMRMECFDISHTGGERTVASCVVFEGGAAKKAAYRRFNIEDIEPGDDYAAMRQALERRFRRLKRGEAPMPDLLLIDGGKGQLAQAESVLQELELADVPVVAVAKGSERKAGREQLFLPRQSQPHILPPNSPALHLIQQIRDEAHRFAVAGHRGRRDKARQQSPLDHIDGLGPIRRKRLLRAFGGTRQIARAGVRDLERVEGISRAMAQRIYEHFHQAG
ncbi:excinuclease ABC subunit UvrC [Spectribacter hydrogenoxidans]|uniref:UvrABC system protein C n=1 Tax=Spectribacter hydrogenoxidans TaxID=3075608 RepID=A0ABU3C254_9GAMM|nr:excinuclease ABC subunit UvrC [Salinisphaera sp. W335]MDT0635635.1 excinuclease ABC subunit UvrC [Salinisphaera sp. W335]